jgi:putative ABC transport system ATP-binding protein
LIFYVGASMTAIGFNRFFQKTAALDSMPSQAMTPAKEAAIVATHINMLYRNGSEEFKALQDVNLMVKAGEVHLLMGPSGSGKTTLLSILAGLLTPTAGQVCLLGEEITKFSRSSLAAFRLQSLGFIFQGFNLFPALTACENVEVAFHLKGIQGQQARHQSIELLKQVGLADRAHHRPQDLSGGQKQRVAIARALAGDPQIIMADEPTAALDSHNGYAVIELLRELAKTGGRTVLIVTHDPRILDVADRVTDLEDGKIVTH